jgi:hypothetical protein
VSANSPWEAYVRSSTSRAQIDELLAPKQDLGQVLEQARA